MKKRIYLRVLCMIAMLFATCNQSVFAQEEIYGESVKLTESEKYALKEPGTRSVGKGVSSRESAAMMRARLEARAAFVEAISSSVTSAIKAAGIDINQYAGDDMEGHEATDGGEKQQNLVKSVANGVIEGATVVKTDKFYNKKTRKYTIFVCLEYNGDVKKLSKEMVNKLKTRISEEDRLKLEFDIEKFEQEIENNLKNRDNDTLQDE